MDTIGSRIATLRASAGLEASELGELAGLKSAPHVRMIELGTRGTNVSAATAIALARVLGTSAEYLVEGTGPAPTAEETIAAVAAARAARIPPGVEHTANDFTVDPEAA